MGHEYIHANLNAGGYGIKGSHIIDKQHHGVISNWELAQAKAWKLSSTSYYSRQASMLSNFKNQIPNYKSFQFQIRSVRPW